MKSLVTSAFVVAALAVPVGLIAASPVSTELQDPSTATKDKKDKKDKSVPAPATLLLIAAAGGVAVGVSRYRRRARR
jgi:uncharacterized OsmC-like protein